MNVRKFESVADLTLLLVAAIWGSSYAVAKQCTLLLPVLQFLALRFGLTFVLMLPALRPLLRPAGRRGLAVAGMLGANLMAILVCETFGVSLTSAGNAAFLISLCVAFTPFAEWALLGVRPTPRVYLAAAASVAGAGLLALSGPTALGAGWGDALMLAAALLRALLVCLTRRLGGACGLPASTLTAVQAGVIAAGCGALSLIVAGGRGAAWPMRLDFWLGIAWLVLFCTVFAFFAQNHAVLRTSPSRVALLMGSEPLFGALVAVLWLGERIGPPGWLGGALIVASALLVTLPGAQPFARRARAAA